MRTRRRAGVLRVAATALVLPLAAGAVVLSLSGALAARERADRAAEARRAVDLEHAVWDLGRARLREVNTAALAALGEVDQRAVRRATAERLAARQRATQRLEAIAEAGGEVGDDAASILEEVGRQDLPTGTVALDRLWDGLVDLQSEAAAHQVDQPAAAALGDLGEVALIAGYVLSDAIDTAFTRDPRPVPPHAETYFVDSVTYVRSGEAGWLADDDRDPFRGTWVPRGPVRRHLPAAERGLVVAFDGRAAREVVALDRWVQEASATGGRDIPPPPYPLAVAAAVAERLGAELDAVMVRTVDQERDRYADAADAARREGAALLALACATVLGLGGVLAWTMHRRRRRISVLERTAETDGLTGLANRRAVQRRVPPRLADPERAGHVVLQLDLDRFKAVNDAYGHRVGDELLLAFAGRAAGVLERRYGASGREVELARVGGDEFLVVVHDSPDPSAEAADLVADLEAAFVAPVACGPLRIRVDLSGGIAVATGPTDFEQLLLEADIALYQAKAANHARFQVFDDPALRDIVRDFPNRLAAGAVRVDLQPQVDLRTGDVVGVEALARWAVDGEVVPAAVWIKAVEQLGGADLLFGAVARAVGQAAAVVDGRLDGRYWLNLSPLQLGEVGAADRLLAHLANGDLRPDQVGVEVLETAALADLGVAAANLADLRAAGVLVALDDFGSGFTPLGHLTALPVDVLKLDREVIAGIDRRPRQAALVEAMVTIADRLGLDLVAEGIETEAERDALRAMGVTWGQGYLLGRPAPVDRVLARLRPAVAPAPA